MNAQNQLATAGNDTPADIAAQRAQVEDAQAAVAIALRDVEETVIIAPVAGIVTAINGAPGEVVAPPSAVTALAPGGGAPLPATNGGVGDASSANAGVPGAGAFVVLDTADPFQLVVPFEEADAARIVPGQLVHVTVDALPNDTFTGRVTSVAPSGPGPVRHHQLLRDRRRRRRGGPAAGRARPPRPTVRVEVGGQRAAGSRVRGRTQRRASHRDRGGPGRRSRESMPFLAGLVGDDYVEVRSGLTDGEEVRAAAGHRDPGPARLRSATGELAEHSAEEVTRGRSRNADDHAADDVRRGHGECTAFGQRERLVGERAVGRQRSAEADADQGSDGRGRPDRGDDTEDERAHDVDHEGAPREGTGHQPAHRPVREVTQRRADRRAQRNPHGAHRAPRPGTSARVVAAPTVTASSASSGVATIEPTATPIPPLSAATTASTA